MTTPPPKLKAVEPAPTPDAKAARREAHDRIAIYFDIASGQYSEGYTDQKIAEETGVSLAWVKQRREDEFGPIKEPTEIAAMRADLAKLISHADELRQRLDALARKHGWD